MESKSCCSSCFSEITNTNRLIVESCGHTKCRNCFITEKISCVQCSMPNPEAKVIENILISPRLNQLESLSKKTIRKHIINMGDQYRCTKCDRAFRSRQQQYYHLHCGEPEESWPHKCGECPRGFLKESHLKYHIKTHSLEKLPCNLCGKEFSNKITLDKHLIKHKQHKKHKCTFCEAEYKDKVSFNFHLSSHGDAYKSQHIACNVCGKIFFLKSQLKRHFLIHTKDRVKLFECGICNSRFLRASSLKDHILKHNSIHKFKCGICNKQFTEEKALRRHEILHNNSIVYECGICEIKLNRKDNLIRHIRNMHPECDGKMLSDSFLKRKYMGNLESLNLKTGISQSVNSDYNTQTTAEFPDEILKQCLGDFRATSMDVVSIDREENQVGIDKKYIKCSVIKSIGNAKPLDVILSPRCVDENIKKVTLTIDPMNISVLANKKLKKKYDPTEMYRKILFVNNDDTSPCSSKDATQINDEVKLESNCKMKDTTTNSHDDINYSNFIEKHWRKNFYS